MPPPSVRAVDASTRILDASERFVQTRGFNGFSYADVAGELSVTKASVHYHFPTKAELGRALVVRYREGFVRALDQIDAASLPANDELARYVALYTAVLREGRMCLCGMVAAEFTTLPKPMQEEIRRFFTANEEWLSKVVEGGAREGCLQMRGTPIETARFLLSALEGAMLVARTYRSVDWFESTAKRVLAELATARDGQGGEPATEAEPRARQSKAAPKRRASANRTRS